MSAGLKFVGNQEPGGAPPATVLDHYFIYTGAIDAFEYSITRPVEFPAETDGRYRNSDPLTIGYLVKRAVQARGEEYLTWPQRRCSIGSAFAARCSRRIRTAISC